MTVIPLIFGPMKPPNFGLNGFWTLIAPNPHCFTAIDRPNSGVYTLGHTELGQVNARHENLPRIFW